MIRDLTTDETLSPESDEAVERVDYNFGLNPIFATGGCMVAQVPENQGWLGKGL
jgi:hypothetical protein